MFTGSPELLQYIIVIMFLVNNLSRTGGRVMRESTKGKLESSFPNETAAHTADSEFT